MATRGGRGRARRKGAARTRASGTRAVSKRARGRRTGRAPAPPRTPRASGAKHIAVRVRMYRQGLGDCHLITFDPDGSPTHVLIDCGTLGATTTGVDMGDVAKDIAAATGGRLHLLIATHEHRDHVSGFRRGTPFDGIQVDQVWLAWTEDARDDLAKSLQKYKGDIHGALRAAAKAAPATGSDAALGISSLVDGLADTVDEAMRYVQTKKNAKVDYLKPGGPAREEPWLPGFRVYVLGPPRDKAALYDLGGHRSAELYGLIGGLGTAGHFAGQGARFAADQETEPEAASQFEEQMPFEARFRCELPAAGAATPFAGSYYDPAEQWRRIDGDWLDPASELALQLDSATNNTSLALAFERVSDGKVLLFPADAQQGSWMSWHDPRLNLGRTVGGKVEPVAIQDLLRRTVFYKVGHHASHNATARANGLEKMGADELTAFIPVDRAVALKRSPPDSWQMPARPLYRRLLEKCAGRVVRSDLGWADDSKSVGKREVEKEFDGLATAAEWTAWKREQKKAETAGRVTIQKLYAEYRLD